MTQDPGTGSRAIELLLGHLDHEREHVLAAVEGLSEDELTRVVAPSGWSIAALLSHLTYDDEIFWIQAIVGGDDAALDQIQDGWQAPFESGAAAVARYREAVERSRTLLAETDLTQPPAWWPPEEVFPFGAFQDGQQCVFRVLVETATHAGHLDVVREQLDGRQHLVVP